MWKSIFSVVATLAPLFLFGSSLFLEVIRPTITSRMSSNFVQIRPLTAELFALECCGHSIAFNFIRIFFILGSNKDSHYISDEFEFQPDLTLECKVIYPWLCEISIFSVVATLAPSFLFGTSLFFEVTKSSIISRMSSNFDQIRPLTAPECLKNQYFVLWPL